MTVIDWTASLSRPFTEGLSYYGNHQRCKDGLGTKPGQRMRNTKYLLRFRFETRGDVFVE